jgi:hypothetical protein
MQWGFGSAACAANEIARQPKWRTLTCLVRKGRCDQSRPSIEYETSLANHLTRRVILAWKQGRRPLKLALIHSLDPERDAIWVTSRPAFGTVC